MRFQGPASKWQVVALVAAVLVMSASDGFAFSRGRAGSYGSYGSGGSYGSYGSGGSYASYGSTTTTYASSGSYGSSGSYASSGSHGSSGRPGLFARWHARKAARKASAGSYGSSGSYASSGSYGSSYSAPAGSAGSYETYSAPVQYSVPTPAEPYCADCVGGVSSSPALAANGEAAIAVTVPADARVFVNDSLTKSTGGDRRFVSRGLASAMTYSYQVRVEYDRAGEPVVETKTVRLQAGQTAALAFDASQPTLAAKPAKTELKVAVPADAKVFLAGSATSQTGESRTFATSTLAAGESWNGYVIRVELNRDGQTLVREETLQIEGGQSYELAFTFDEAADQLASVN